MSKSLTEIAAERLRAELAIKQMRGGELARQLGVSHATVTRRLTGETPLAVDEIEEIAAILEIPVARLLPNEVAA